MGTFHDNGKAGLLFGGENMEKVNVRMSNEQLHTAIKYFLMEHDQGSLATTINNIPRSSPVLFFLGNDLDIYILSAGGDKFKAIGQNPNVCLLVNIEYLDYKRIKGVQIFGTARAGEKRSDVFREAEGFCTDRTLMDREDIKVIKITPSEIVYLDSTKNGDRTKQTYKLQ